ncbi:MAG: aminotransferase class IV [Candidatus Margulisiibacteriota bacterium]
MGQTKAYINGRTLSLTEAKISVLDRGFLYGDGVFESLRTFNRKPFLLDEHLKRLLSGAKTLKISHPYSLSFLKSAVFKTLAANNFKEYYIKIILTRGEAKGHGLNFSNSTGKPNLIILVEKLKEYSKTIYRYGWKAIISTIVRPNTPTSRIKSLCYLDNALAKEEAIKHKAQEAFMLDEAGRVVEGTISNIFIVKSNIIYTPPLDEPILSGVTRAFVLKLSKRLSLRVAEKPFFPKDLYHCDECFITFSGAGIVPITKIEEKKIGNGQCGPITNKLIVLYQKEAQK